MITIIAFDLATLTGWAHNGNPPGSGTEKFDVSRGGSPGSRYFRFVRWTQDLIAAVKPDLILYEQPHQRGGAATEICLGLATHLQSVCHVKKIEHVAIPASTIKIFATGKGKADKEEMMTACAAKLGIIPEDDNHSDALWLLEYGKANYDKVDLIPYQHCTAAQKKRCLSPTQ